LEHKKKLFLLCLVAWRGGGVSLPGDVSGLAVGPMPEPPAAGRGWGWRWPDPCPAAPGRALAGLCGWASRRDGHRWDGHLWSFLPAGLGRGAGGGRSLGPSFHDFLPKQSQKKTLATLTVLGRISGVLSKTLPKLNSRCIQSLYPAFSRIKQGWEKMVSRLVAQRSRVI